MSEGIIILVAVVGSAAILSLAGEFFYWLRTREYYHMLAVRPATRKRCEDCDGTGISGSKDAGGKCQSCDGTGEV